MEEKEQDVVVGKPSNDAWRMAYRLIVAQILPRVAGEQQERLPAEGPAPHAEEPS